MAEPVLVLRPEPGAARTAKMLREAGFDPICYPLFAVESAGWTPPDPADFDAVLMTSANAARVGGAGLALYRDLPVFAVGDASGRAAAAAGFGSVTVGGGDVAATLPLVAAGSRVLHLSGEDVRDADPLGLSITRVPVYRTVPLGNAEELASLLPQNPLPRHSREGGNPSPNPDTGWTGRGMDSRLRGNDERKGAAIALLHSPRAAAHFASLVNDAHRTQIALVTISDATAQACGNGWKSVAVAASPDDPAMLARLRTLV
ncbi:MAG: uroporphyrinogen-III synthase [Sphingobium sp.]